MDIQYKKYKRTYFQKFTKKNKKFSNTIVINSKLCYNF